MGRSCRYERSSRYVLRGRSRQGPHSPDSSPCSPPTTALFVDLLKKQRLSLPLQLGSLCFDLLRFPPIQ
jgi:hypothetical protein